MTALLVIGPWWAFLALIAWALCRSSAQADERLERARADRLDALNELGDAAGTVVFDFTRRHR